MIVATRIFLYTSIDEANFNLSDGWDEYYKYLENSVYKLSGDAGDVVYLIKSKSFGEAKLRFYIDQSFNDIDYKICVYIEIEPVVEMALTKDDAFNKLEEDSELTETIKSKLDSFIEGVNANLKSLIVPKEENFIYKHGIIFVEVFKGATYSHTVEWIPVQLYNMFNEDDIADYCEVK